MFSGGPIVASLFGIVIEALFALLERRRVVRSGMKTAHEQETSGMYVPPHFREDDRETIFAAIERARLGTLVTVGPAGPLVSHVPMLLDRNASPNGTLLCHLSRANAQWRTPAEDALAIFLGPDAYITPSWYETKDETGKVVPTWNYIAVHVYGPMRVIEEPRELSALIHRLTTQHEAPRDEPWAMTDAPSDFIAGQLRGIVGIEIPLARLVGKWKMSENRSDADFNGVVAGLAASSDPLDRAVANEMATRRLRSGEREPD